MQRLRGLRQLVALSPNGSCTGPGRMSGRPGQEVHTACPHRGLPRQRVLRTQRRHDRVRHRGEPLVRERVAWPQRASAMMAASCPSRRPRARSRSSWRRTLVHRLQEEPPRLRLRPGCRPACAPLVCRRRVLRRGLGAAETWPTSTQTPASRARGPSGVGKERGLQDGWLLRDARAGEFKEEQPVYSGRDSSVVGVLTRGRTGVSIGPS